MSDKISSSIDAIAPSKKAKAPAPRGRVVRTTQAATKPPAQTVVVATDKKPRKPRSPNKNPRPPRVVSSGFDTYGLRKDLSAKRRESAASERLAEKTYKAEAKRLSGEFNLLSKAMSALELTRGKQVAAYEGTIAHIEKLLASLT